MSQGLVGELPKQAAKTIIKPIASELSEVKDAMVGQITGNEVKKQPQTKADIEANKSFQREIYGRTNNLSENDLSQLQQHEDANNPINIEAIRARLAQERGETPSPVDIRANKDSVPAFKSQQHREMFHEAQRLGQTESNAQEQEKLAKKQQEEQEEIQKREEKKAKMNERIVAVGKSMKGRMQKKVLKVQTKTETGKLSE